MAKYKHLHRYAAKKKSPEVANIEIAGESAVVYNGALYDLRTGKKQGKQGGFRFALDGRHLAFEDGKLTINHPERGKVRAEAKGSISTLFFVGPWLVVSDDGRKPFLVIDANTGKALGRIEGQAYDGTREAPVYNPAIFDPRDGLTLWLGEGARLVQVDVALRRTVRVIEAPADHRFFGVASLEDGHVLAIVRRRDLKFDPSADRLAVFDPDGKMTSIDGSATSLERLGDRFITSDSRGKRFAIYNKKLELVDRVPMFEPGKEAYSRVLPLPSGREWIAVGGYGEWDHYGPPDLEPGKLEAPPGQRPAAKVASKKPRKSAK